MKARHVPRRVIVPHGLLDTSALHGSRVSDVCDHHPWHSNIIATAGDEADDARPGIDARDDRGRQARSHASTIDSRPPRTDCTLRSIQRLLHLHRGCRPTFGIAAGCQSRSRGLCTQAQPRAPFNVHMVGTFQPQARQERSKWCRSYSFWKAGSGRLERPRAHRPVRKISFETELSRHVYRPRALTGDPETLSGASRGPGGAQRRPAAGGRTDVQTAQI